jgi:hypothetical protein
MANDWTQPASSPSPLAPRQATRRVTPSTVAMTLVEFWSWFIDASSSLRAKISVCGMTVAPAELKHCA